MMAALPQTTLNEYVQIRGRFLRSTNLAQDYASRGINGDYIVTANARQALYRLSEGLSEGALSRAWTITGPYGAGKSAFGVFLTRVLCSEGKEGQQAREKLLTVDPSLAEKIAEKGVWSNGHQGMLPVLLTARRAPVSLCILEGLRESLGRLSGNKAQRLQKEIGSLLDDTDARRYIDSKMVVELLLSLGTLSSELGRAGVLLVIDELGKLFEYAARDPKQGDVFLLQEIAERACRSSDVPILLVGFLHQSFEDYGQHLDLVTRREWEKIGGRFDDLPFLEPPDQVIRMIAQAIRHTDDMLPTDLAKKVQQTAFEAADCGIVPPGMASDEFVRTAINAYPLHPVVLVSLPYLFKRFAQNERSLFSYLSTQEPHAFQEFLLTQLVEGQKVPFLRLPKLFDYFTSNFGIGLYRQPHAKRWLEAEDVLERRGDLSALHADTIKCIGILNALGEFSHLSADESTISLCLRDSVAPNVAVSQALGDLRERSVLTYRKFNESYRIWEGSDVDIEDRVTEGKRKLRGDSDLAEAIREYMPPRPLVARRHSFQTGALRFFDVMYIEHPDQLSGKRLKKGQGDARVFVCIASTGKQLEDFVTTAKSKPLHDRKDLLIAIPQEIGELRAAVRELGALQWAWENTPELRDDRVARREISLRISEAEHLLTRDLNALLDPRPEPLGSECLWFYRGDQQKVGRPSEIAQLLSYVCDQLFSKAPRIRNELIARRSLSSAATAARRTLLDRMLTNDTEPMLGIEGYPPERSMYESVLMATGLHREIDGSAWGFSEPLQNSDYNLAPCWKMLEKKIYGPKLEPVSVEELFSVLGAPPYGMPDGLHVVLLCAFMMVHRDEISLYREGTFRPDYGIADFEVLVRRPNLYAVAGSRAVGTRKVVVERIAASLGVTPATVPVVRALFGMVKALPEFAWHTRRVPEKVIAIRDTFQDARSPERFLFHELPVALGHEPFSEESATDDIDLFFATLNQNLQTWANAGTEAVFEAKQSLLTACGVEDQVDAWEELRRRAGRVVPSVTEPGLLSFLRRLVDSPADNPGVEAVLALVANRPPHSWRDSDVERFPAVAENIGNAFQNALERFHSGSAGDVKLRPEERKRAKRLSKEIAARLRDQTGEHPSHIVRAALLMLARDLNDEQEHG